MQALRKAIAETQLSNPQLSLKLGHSKKYLTNLLNDGCSTALQERLIEEISQVMAGTFKTDAMVIAELSQQLAEAQDLAGERLVALQHQQTECTKLRASAASLMEESDVNHNLATDRLAIIQKLDSNLEYAVKTAQNDAETILALKDNQTYLLNKYERQKRNSSILWVLLFLTVISWVAVSV